MKILDNTMVSAYKECPRKYHLAHEKYWIPDSPNIHFIFGEGWHSAMDAVYTYWDLLKDGNAEDTEMVYRMALRAFMKVYRREIAEEADMDYHPKNPTRVLDALPAYIQRMKEWPMLYEGKLLALEEPFIVSVGIQDVMYTGKVDKIISSPQGTWVIDHKTTSYTPGVFSRSLRPNSQFDGYLFAAGMTQENVKGLIVDTFSCRKPTYEFAREFLDKAWSDLDAWQEDLMFWCKGIISTEDRPRNTSSCHLYGGCKYRDICTAFPKMKDLPDDPTTGFKVQEWSPLDEETRLKLGV